MLAITICATQSYAYAMKALAHRISSNLGAAKYGGLVQIIISGDDSSTLGLVVNYYRSMFGASHVTHLVSGYENSGENYKEQAQLLIARMREAAFIEARRIGATMCWSLDSDTLPPPNALRCMIDGLNFDGGYYSVSTCPYPNTAFLGGFGTYSNPIAEDFLPHERKVPEDLLKELADNEAEGKRYHDEKKPVPEDVREKWSATHKKIRECPPDGSIWEVIAKHGWRRRGWLDSAYPAIGKGAMVPSDWCGFGCTLMSKEALLLTYFDGYDGKGTEDLFICWRRWHPAGLRINVIPHAPCDHVIWAKKKGGNDEEYTLHHSYHEPAGEYAGHLRVRQTPWIPCSQGGGVVKYPPWPTTTT